MNKSSRWLSLSAWLVYAFLYIPLFIVVLFSFNESKQNAEWTGFTLHWYHELLANGPLWQAALNSLLIALVTAAVSTVLGTMTAMVLHRHRAPVLQFTTVTPIAIPEILTGISLVLFFNMLDFTLGYVSVTLAHITFCIGFVAIVVRSRLAGMDEALVEAARDLGATPWRAFRDVTLPLIMPGVIAGALMAFTLSVDDFVITFFTAGPNAETLPLTIYSMVKTTIKPDINALSTLLIGLTLLITTAVAKLAPGSLKNL